ncbi:hypothetical protein BHE18_03140 [Rossellomorea aquimaris]|uniref:Uncharacterized protein n=1 Tax=Rossellomorea aquimaris TaxID=189382 RepID=A0A1J6WTX0_9BACI|nr:hypothetical protein BHE18_03140 [Rossellomorea aquimaris]
MGIFGLSVSLLFELEFGKSTSTSYNQAASQFTKSNNRLVCEKSFLKTDYKTLVRIIQTSSFTFVMSGFNIK